MTAQLSRRQFVKVGALGTALAGAGATGMLSYGGWLREANADEVNQDERIAHTFHKTHCIGPCSLACTVREGRLSLIEPNSWGDSKRETICLKALSEIEHVYSPERIQTPLKRVGERGSGEFAAITWDEALQTIQEKINEAKAQYGPESIFTYTSGEADMHYPFILVALGGQWTPYIGVDTGCDNGFTPAFGESETSATNEVSDWVNAKNIFFIGTNYLESNLPDVRWFFEAKDRGAHITVIDPAFTSTASKADEWIPINPGYSSALVHGMITVILENEWYDEDFVLQNTSLPFLIDKKTGMFIREQQENVAVSGGEGEGEGEAPPSGFLVWDTASSSVQPFDAEGVVPALRGEYKYGDVDVITAFSLLEEQQKEFSLAWASEKTGIAEEVLFDLTKRYATDGPSNITYGFGGPDKWHNADVFGHLLILLGSLTGNIGKRGAGVGYCALGLLNNMAGLAEWPLTEINGLIGPFFSDLEHAAADFKYVDSGIKVVVNLGDAMFLRGADWNKQKEWLETLDFILTIDPYYVNSVNYSDIILPAATRFECRDDYGFVYCVRNHMLLQEKVIEPLHDSKTDFEIDVAVSSLFIDPDQFPKTLAELTKYQLENAEDPLLEGITIDSLIENNGVMKLNVPDDPIVMFEDQVYGTPSGRLELYYENMVSWGQAFPTFEEPLEAYHDNALRETYPLQFGQPRSKYYIHNQFCESSWIQQLTAPHVDLNPIDGEERGLKTGDLAEVFNDRGSFKVTYSANESVRPGTCRSYYGIWPKFLKEGHVQEVTNGELNPRGYELPCGPVVPFNDTLVDIRKAGEGQ